MPLLGVVVFEERPETLHAIPDARKPELVTRREGLPSATLWDLPGPGAVHNGVSEAGSGLNAGDVVRDCDHQPEAVR